MKKQFLIVSIFLFTISTFAQYNLNDYKYVIIPIKFAFLKQSDQYQLNSLTKFLLEKEKFTVYFDDENLPNDLVSNRCLALYGNVLDDSKFFKTNLSLTLKDCNNKEIFTTQQGDSKLKDYQKAYYEALREAFLSFDSIHYQYQPKEVEEMMVVVTPKPEVKKVEEVGSISMGEEKVVIETVREKVKSIKEKFGESILIATPFDLGYNVMDSKSNVVMTLLMTAIDDVYLVKDKNAMVSKRNNSWLYSENNGIDFYVGVINIEFQ